MREKQFEHLKTVLDRLWSHALHIENETPHTHTVKEYRWVGKKGTKKRNRIKEHMTATVAMRRSTNLGGPCMDQLTLKSLRYVYCVGYDSSFFSADVPRF